MNNLLEIWGLYDVTKIQTILVRIFLAALFGGLLGLERTRKRRPAGLRTYMLVCLGATVVTMVGVYSRVIFETNDPGRLPAQIISGIGFLGAGTIMVTRYHRVKGLTTAAGLWCAACMGIALGFGYYWGAIITFVVMILTMIFADKLESAYTRSLRRLQVYIVFDDIRNLSRFIKAMRQEGLEPFDLETTSSNTNAGVGLFCLIKIPKDKNRLEVLEIIEDHEGVLLAEEIDS